MTTSSGRNGVIWWGWIYKGSERSTCGAVTQAAPYIKGELYAYFVFYFDL